LKFWEGFWEEKVFRMEKSVFCLGWAADFVWDLTWDCVWVGLLILFGI
jgi:hypothetical protein